MNKVIIHNKLTGIIRRINEGEEFRLLPGDLVTGSEITDYPNAQTGLSNDLAEEGILLGDAVKWMIDKVSLGSIKSCTICQARQELLNEYHRRGKEFVKFLGRKLKGRE